MGAIEQAILRGDRQGIGRAARHLPDDYCERTARFVLEHPGRVLVITGFFILHAGSGDTDGPMGAMVLGHALSALGNDVRYVTDGPNVMVIRGLIPDPTQVMDFPWGERDASRIEARHLLDDLRPSLLVAVDRVGFAQGERYLNHRGMDITLAMAKLDFLFEGFPASVGIGDGGNEIGMGNLARELVVEDVTPYPALTRTTHIIPAATSLWGSYGLVAALSNLTGRDLLPSEAVQEQWLRRAVELGAVDATTGKRETTVDGWSLSECCAMLNEVRSLITPGLASRSKAGLG